MQVREKTARNLVISTVLSKTGKYWAVLKNVAVTPAAAINVIVATSDLSLSADSPHTP